MHEVAHALRTPALVLTLVREAPPGLGTGLPFLPCSHVPREEPCTAGPGLQAPSFPPRAAPLTEDSGQSQGLSSGAPSVPPLPGAPAGPALTV